MKDQIYQALSIWEKLINNNKDKRNSTGELSRTIDLTHLGNTKLTSIGVRQRKIMKILKVIWIMK